LNAETSKDIPSGKPDEVLALNKFKAAIENQAQEKANQIIADAKEKVEQIISEQQKEMDQMKREIISSMESEAKLTKIREVSRKKQALKMDYLESRELLFEEIDVEIKSKLLSYTQTDKYPIFLKSEVEKCALAMGGGSLEIQLRSEDKSHFSSDSLKSMAKMIEEKTGNKSTLKVSDVNIDNIGGFKILRSDNKLFIDNSFEARLERNQEDARIAILDILSK
jgi:V/A-type H+-transporting ATPase subunit E